MSLLGPFGGRHGWVEGVRGVVGTSRVRLLLLAGYVQTYLAVYPSVVLSFPLQT